MFYIRVDANEIIATGHLMRCMAIAEEIKELGQEITFITADHKADDLIEKKGFFHYCLHSDWENPEGELKELCFFLKEKNIKKLLIDSYRVTEKYMNELNQLTQVIYINDENILIPPIAMEIYYSLGAEKKKRKYPQTQYLYGIKYLPLRREFRDVRPIFREDVRTVMVTTGGTDPYDLGGALAKYFSESGKYKDISFLFVVGALANEDNILRYITPYGNIQCEKNISNISDFMKKSDLAISACGSTMYELCRCGVPILTFSFADNQLHGINKFENYGIAVNCGDCRNGIDLLVANIAKALDEIIDNKRLRKKMFEKQITLVDGMGARRLANKILEL